MLPIVFVHGYSSEGKNNPVEKIYGSLPADLSKEFGRSKVLDLNLSRWISLDDGIALDDISFAMERALGSPQFKSLLKTGFHVVIHSTGALVVRNWIRLYSPKPCPIANLVHLAGANFGSGLAHVGQGTLARYARQIFQGVEPGAQVLDELEFGASKTLDLHLHFLQPGNRMVEDYGVREYCAIGSQTLNYLRAVPVRYVKEDSADNTVRTSACNLNFNYITIQPTKEAYSISLAGARKEVDLRLEGEQVSMGLYKFDIPRQASTQKMVPFAVLYDTAHFGKDLGIVNGTKTRKRVLPLLVQALNAPDDDTAWEQIASDWDKVTHRTLVQASKLKGSLTDWNRRNQYEAHSQLIFRVRDQFGRDVIDPDITFKSGGGANKNRLEKMIEDDPMNNHNKGTQTFYLRTQEFTGKGRPKKITNLLDSVRPVEFEITGYEQKSKEIKYLPLRVRVNSANIGKLIQPFRTTLVDVTLLRLPTNKVFALKKVKKGK